MSIKSNDSILTVLPSIVITSQPQDTRTSVNINAEFTLTATISDNRYPIQYYWTVDDVIQPKENSNVFLVSSQGEKTVICRGYAFVDITSRNEGQDITSRVIQASDTATWNIGPPRSIVRFEGFTPTGGYKSIDANLDDGDFTLDDTMFDSTYNIVTYYAREKNLDLTLYMDGAPGLTSSSNQQGGEGGRSAVTLTHTQNIEHVVLGTTNNSGIFLYRGANLLLVAGQGGQGGSNSAGADGGGVNIAGANGTNSSGGTLVSSGQLTLNGSFGSLVSTVSLQPNDTLETAPNGGRTISCTKGNYWTSLGISPCSDNSTNKIKFRINDGTEVSLSDDIIRGFKPGYTITSTEGRASGSAEGKGGRGATGGAGGTSGHGGAGGSGYTDGTAKVVTTQLGGNTGKAKIKFSLVPPPVLPPPTKTKTGVFTHGFNLSSRSIGPYLVVGPTTYINFNGAIESAQIVHPYFQPYGLQRFGNSRSNYFIIITMNDLYSSITVELLDDRIAGGGEGPAGLLLTKVENMGGGRRWGVWFNLPSSDPSLTIGMSFFAVQWRVTGGSLGTPPNPGAEYPGPGGNFGLAQNFRLP